MGLCDEIWGLEDKTQRYEDTEDYKERRRGNQLSTGLFINLLTEKEVKQSLKD